MNDVEEKWRLNASRLTSKQIGTRLWNEFKDALSCLQEGDDESVEAWVDETEARFIASAESSDRLGTSLVMAHQADRDLLVAGGSGGKAAVFYCSKLLPAAKRGSRCK